MSALDPQKTLQDEASCSICLDYFQNPVMVIDCGHNFCQDCITKCSEPFHNLLCCPQCRRSFPQGNLRPNRHLWNIVDLAKQFSLQRANEAGEQKLCQKHQEPLKLFCEQDQTSICVVCDRSKVHRHHNVIPVDEAAQLYKEKIQTSVQALKNERDKILSLKLDAEKPSYDLLTEVKAERQELVLEFQQLRQLLEKEEQLLLSQLANLEAEIEKKKEEQAAQFSEEVSHIAALIGELEQKCQESPSTMLQDIESIFTRCKRKMFQCPAQLDYSELKQTLKEFSRASASLQQELRKFRESLTEPKWIKESLTEPKWIKESLTEPKWIKESLTEPKWIKESLTEPKWIKENVTLDPVTAHPRFIMSEDRKRVCWNSVRRDLSYHPRRFDPSRCVLGSEGFSSGKHYWATNVTKGTSWVVGVAKESVKRKGQLTIAPEEGIWAVGFSNGQYRSLLSPPVILNLEKNLRVIQIYLNYEKETVAFWDVEDRICFALFTSLRFQSEKIFPFFRVGDMNTMLRLC